MVAGRKFADRLGGKLDETPARQAVADTLAFFDKYLKP